MCSSRTRVAYAGKTSISYTYLYTHAYIKDPVHLKFWQFREFSMPLFNMEQCNLSNSRSFKSNCTVAH